MLLGLGEVTAAVDVVLGDREASMEGPAAAAAVGTASRGKGGSCRGIRKHKQHGPPSFRDKMGQWNAVMLPAAITQQRISPNPHWHEKLQLHEVGAFQH